MSTPREQAAQWFARMQDSGVEPAQRARFEAWLAANPQHAREYQAFADLWDDFSSTRRSEALAGILEQRRRRQRRQLLQGGALALLLAVAGPFGWNAWRQGPQELNVYTAIGEQRSVDLRDGSELIVNADSRLHVRYDGSSRQVELLRGEAIFDVARNPDRPFVIDGGLARVRVLGTRFVVNRLPDRLRISVEHGQVQVDSLTSAGGQQRLVAGEVLEVDAKGRLQRLPLSAEAAFAFQRGSLIFEQADLAEISASLARYRKRPLRAELGQQTPRISAVVQLSDVESFVQALPQVAAVRLERDGDSDVLRPKDDRSSVSKTIRK